MPIISWPEWLPDQPDFGSAGSPNIRNCIPLTPKSYGPMPSPVVHSDNALDERCQGAYSLKASDASVHFFAGDRQKLYVLPPGPGRTLEDVTRASGSYSTPSQASGGFWSMTSYGSRVLATNGFDPIQSLMVPLSGGAKFEDLTAAPDPLAPVARYIATVKDFVMVGYTTDPVDGLRPNRVWWSGINNPTGPNGWPLPGSVTALQVMSDYQDLQQTDLGVITGLQSGFSQGSDVVVFLERGIVTGAFVGPPLLFNFRVAQGASGTTSPLSIVQDHARTNSGATIPVIYYLSEDGFSAFDGSTSIPIGAQKFDREFLSIVDHQYINYVQGVSDPRSRAVFWAFPSLGSNGLFDKILVYNWELGRGTIIDIDDPAMHMEWLTGAMFATGYNLDTIDSFGDLDTVSPPFDDPFWVGNSGSRLTMFCQDHRMHIGGGPPFGPVLETGELQPSEARRAWVTLTRPLSDGTGLSPGTTIAVGHRERLTDPVVWGPAVTVNAIGECPQRTTGRYLRYRLTMPPGGGWSQTQGIEVRMVPDAARR
jgi:hypothetical protein